jgi:hypothetical protein
VKTWYMPMMSRCAAEQFHQILFGDKPKSFAEKNLNSPEFCLREIWHDPIATYKGFNQSQPAKCNYDGNYFGECFYYSDCLEKYQKGKVV